MILLNHIVINYLSSVFGTAIAVYRIQNNITDGANQFKVVNVTFSNASASVTFNNPVQSGDVVLAISNLDRAGTQTWTRPNQNASISYSSLPANTGYASEIQAITGSYTSTVNWSITPASRALLGAITIR